MLINREPFTKKTFNKIEECIKVIKEHPNYNKRELYSYLHISASTFDKILKLIKEKYGIEYKYIKRCYVPHPIDYSIFQKRNDEIFNLYKLGMRPKQLSEKYNVSKMRISQILKKYNVKDYHFKGQINE